MKFISLIDGGHQSLLNTLQCISLGHELVCIANLRSSPPGFDSKLYRTSCSNDVVELIAACLEVPMLQCNIKGKLLENNQESHTNGVEGQGQKDEIDDLFDLLEKIKKEKPEIQAVASGLSKNDYKRRRIEDCC